MEIKFCGAVFFDIDGTLIHIEDHISDEERKTWGERKRLPPPSAKKAIEELRKRGYLVAIATGRSEEYVPDLEIDINCLVSANGAVVRLDGEIVYTDTLSAIETKALADYFTSKKVDYMFETVYGCYLGEGTDPDFVWAGKTYPPVSEFRHGEVCAAKVTAYYNDEIIAECEKLFGDMVDLVPHRYDSYMDISKKGVSKASGVKKVIDLYGIDIGDSYAFGDDLNDLEMLSSVGHGIAMTPHAAALSDVAEYVTSSVEDDGVYKGLKHYGLVE